jgi:thioredoxin 1
VESVLKDKQDYELTIIDIEEEQELTSQYKVRSVPTIVFIKDNNIIDKFSGSVTKDILIAKIDAHRS